MKNKKEIKSKPSSRTEYVAFRTSKTILEKFKKFATDKKLSVGELINIAVLDYMGETYLLNELFKKKIFK